MNFDLCRSIANGTAAVEQYVGLVLFAIALATLLALAVVDLSTVNRKGR